MGNSCSESKDCEKPGECCGVSGHCTANAECSVEDGRLAVGAACSGNSECATGCCSSAGAMCVYDSSECAGAANGSRLFFIVGLFALVLAVILTVCFILLYKKWRRSRRMRHQLDPRQASQIPMAEAVSGDSPKPKRIPVARRVMKSQVDLRTTRPPPVVADARVASIDASSVVEQLYIAEKAKTGPDTS